LFLADSPRLMAELREAVVQDDTPRLKIAAHTLIGSLGIFGDSAALDQALKLESIATSGSLTGAAEIYMALEEELNRLKPALAELVAPVATS
jgi:HPt (histidine-containing phosphotransfer) domain-containing protein